MPNPEMQRPAKSHTPAADIDQSQPSPEQAAQQFRRVNRGLPDGVRYEPLDEDTMRLLREHGHLPKEPEPSATTTHHQAPVLPSQGGPTSSQNQLQLPPTGVQSGFHPQIPSSTASQLPTPDQQSIIDAIEGLIQDERNANIFYSHLAISTNSETIAFALNNIAKDSNRHIQKLTEAIIAQFGRGFTPMEAEINTGLEMQSALALALGEANKTLRNLAELLDRVNNSELEKILQRMINKKIVNYNQLQSFKEE